MWLSNWASVVVQTCMIIIEFYVFLTGSKNKNDHRRNSRKQCWYYLRDPDVNTDMLWWNIQHENRQFCKPDHRMQRLSGQISPKVCAVPVFGASLGERRKRVSPVRLFAFGFGFVGFLFHPPLFFSPVWQHKSMSLSVWWSVGW